jgi:hypothetical protein
MKKNLLFLFTFAFITISIDYGQISPIEKGLQAINQNVIKSQLGFLASDWTEGRAAGEKGELLSADYIASMLQLYGVKPGGDQLLSTARTSETGSINRSYFQNFVLIKSTPAEEQVFKVKSLDGATVKTTGFASGIDFSVRYVPSDIEIEAPVVFAGYGFKNDKLKFNDFSKIDVKGKFILKITGTPLFANSQITQLEISQSETEVLEFLKTNGAAGIIEIYPNRTVMGTTGSNDLNNMSPAENFPRPAYRSYSIPGKINPDNLLRINASIKTANEILKGTGIVIEEYIKKADANQQYLSSPVTGKSVYLRSAVKTTTVTVRNVIGIIEGDNPDEVIVLGAHFDHMGMNNGYVWNGADDNGSGTVGVMTLAKAIMETGKKPEKTIIIALWTAEEEGLLGSRYWVQNPTCPLKNVKLNVNFDMISRYISDQEPKKVTMTYSNSFPGFRDITATNLEKYGIDLLVDYQPSADPPGGTDHRSFVTAGIPIIRFKPGHREEYHTPDDELGTINWDIMEKIIKISFADVWELANSGW